MRLIFKILLFPVTLVLTILILVCRFLCDFSTVILGIIAFVFFMLGLGTMILLKEVGDGFKILLIAYVISPYACSDMIFLRIDTLTVEKSDLS